MTVFVADREDVQLGEVRVLDVAVRLRVDAVAGELDLDYAPAVREPRVRCVPEAGDLPDFKEESLWYGVVPARLALNVEVLVHRKVLSLEARLHLAERRGCLCRQRRLQRR